MSKRCQPKLADFSGNEDQAHTEMERSCNSRRHGCLAIRGLLDFDE
jgi:hypothetical protein